MPLSMTSMKELPLFYFDSKVPVRRSSIPELRRSNTKLVQHRQKNLSYLVHTYIHTYIDTAAEIGRNPVSKHQIQSECRE